VSTERVRRTLARVIDCQGIRESAIILNVVATNWQTGQARIFENADFTEELGISPVLASAAIPGIFPSHRIDGVPYVDGTVVENTPLKPSIAAGASIIHVIEPPSADDFPPGPVPSAVEAFYRSLVIMLNVLLQRDFQDTAERNRGVFLLDRLQRGEEIGEPDLASAGRMLARRLARASDKPPYRLITVHRYIPSRHFGSLAGLLDFSRQNIMEMIQAGYSSAVEHDCRLSGCERAEWADEPARYSDPLPNLELPAVQSTAP
jgi:predicted acylesterase/phospholipase RssA